MRYVGALGFVLIAGASSILWPALTAVQAQAAAAAPQTLPPVAAQVQPPAVGASAQLLDAQGAPFATATLREAPDQVLINLVFPPRSAPTGAHAIQIHEVGRCNPPDFASAGGIFNPFGKQHGLRNPAGPMAGDVPSLVIGPNGVASYNTAAPLVKLSPGPASLLRPGGTALVIFGQADDDQTQPDGNAGARIACGVIVAGAPAPSAAPRSPQATNPGDPDLTTALLIGALGTLLIAAGVSLRRSRQS